MKDNSLPLGFEKLKTEKAYVKLSKLADGEHRFRIVSRPIAGWIDWQGKQPHRFRPDNKPTVSFDPEKRVRAFWALHVWDYSQQGLYIMEITQIGVIKALENYALNEDWGDLTSFDIKIKKEGSGMDTEYVVIPVPHKPISDLIKKTVQNTQIRLEALYEGKDPWTDLEEAARSVGTSDTLNVDQLEKLQDLIDQVDEDSLEILYKALGVTCIFELTPKDFDRTVRSLEKKIRDTKGASNDGQVA